ncbi:hypothetical protein ACHQM5_028750 [Ranunculus cassubicifolius]
MQSHMKQIILDSLIMPNKMPLHLPYCHLIFFKFGISFSGTNTENASQFKTSKKGGTKLSEIITGTHS